MPSLIASIEDLDTELESDEEETGARTYKTRHLVTTTTTSVTEAQLRNDESMPVQHVTTLAIDTACLCRRRNLRRAEHAQQWYLTVTWSTHRAEEDEDEDPFARAVVGGIRCLDKEVPAFHDARGVLAINAAGDLYRGFNRIVNIEVIEVTLYSAAWPTALRALNNTINNGPVSMFGETYAPRTLWMKNLRLPSKPTEQYGINCWETYFELHHDPEGYYQLVPNAGLHELQYWTRETTGDDWERVDYATYDAESTENLRRVTRERIESGSQQNIANEVWLNEHGEAVVPSLAQPTGVTATSSYDDSTVTLTGGTIDSSYVGTIATITSFAFNGKTVSLPLRIESIGGGGASFESAEAHDASFTADTITFAGAGALFNYLEMQTAGDWSALPLPAAPPDLGND